MKLKVESNMFEQLEKLDLGREEELQQQKIKKLGAEMNFFFVKTATITLKIYRPSYSQ